MDLAPQIKEYLIKKQWDRKDVGDGKNIAVHQCPFDDCKKRKWKFYIHAKKGYYHCWHCGRGGTLYKLKKELGDLGTDTPEEVARKQGKKLVPMDKVDLWHQNLLANEVALKYCTDKRGITLDTIKHFKLGYRRVGGKAWLCIPHFGDEVCYNVKFRSLPPAGKTFNRVDDCPSVLFNADAINQYDNIVLAEAELDAISLYQAGITNVVSLTCGVTSFPAEWYDALHDKDSITLVMDQDKPGRDGAKDIARRIGFDKCKNAELPLHDANDVLIQMGPEELKRVVDEAKLFDVHGVTSAADVIFQCLQYLENKPEGITTPWPSVNRIFPGGAEEGDLVIVSARFKTGKSTWAMNWAYYIALARQIPIGIMCLEMKTRRLGTKFVAMTQSKDIAELCGLNYQLARYHARNLPFYFVEPDWTGKQKVDDILDKIREAVKRFGIRFFIFDHLHFLCRSIANITTEVGQVTKKFKLLAEELDIVLLLIVQPKKLYGKIIGSDDLKDSSNIPADADHVILLHRDVLPAGLDPDSPLEEISEKEILDPKTLVRVDATRFGSGGEVYLHYEGQTSTFHELSFKNGDGS